MSKPSGTAGDTSNGNRNTGTAPRRRSASSANPGITATSSRVACADQRTAPAWEWISGASDTVSVAAKPTPNRPTEDPARLADARSVDNACTPAASSGAPVFAAVNTPSHNVNRSRPGNCARPAASEAFCASSTTNRSR